MKRKELFKIKNIINLILVIIWMIVVFLFSAEPVIESSKTSGNFIQCLITLVYKDLPTDALEQRIEILQPIIRKVAHFTLYTIGGFLILNFLYNKDKLKKSILLTIFVGILYATLDEIHQLFVPGRGASIKDVLIDSSGVIFGICMYILIRKILKNLHNFKK